MNRSQQSLLLLGLLTALGGCDRNSSFARAVRIQTMAETIGGPAATARPGDILLENDRIRAVIHARRNQRSTFPIGNGSLVDLDLQRPHARFGAGRGADAFYELGPMVNLQVSSSTEIRQGMCGDVGGSPCPEIAGVPNTACARVSSAGGGDTIFGILGLLDLAILRNFPAKELHLTTDYDLCPGEAFVRITTTARFSEGGPAFDIPELSQRTGLLDALLGEHSGIDCSQASCPQSAPHCDDLLLNLTLGSLRTEMKRCRSDSHGLAGILAGDFTFFSAKASIFLPGLGFDHETFSRSVFDTGGDIFSNPMALDYVAAVGNDVSYAYFNQSGKMMLPIFSAAFTLAMSNRLNCPRSDPSCFLGQRLRFRRFVSVGQGDTASALAGFYQIRGIPTGRIEGNVVDLRSRRPVSDSDVYALRVPAAWDALSDAELAKRTYADLAATLRAETKGPDNPVGEAGMVSHFRSDTGLDQVLDGSFGGPIPPGRYLLVTRSANRPASALVPVRVNANATTRAVVFAADSGVLEFEVRDGSNRRLPSKLTFGHCFPECARDEDCTAPATCNSTTSLCTPPGGFTSEDACRQDMVWDATAGTCRCPSTGRLPLEMGGARFADGTVRTVFASGGRGRVRMEPGTYQVIASRGPEYEISKHFVTLKASTVSRLEASLPRVVDTKGWISADFHVHGPNSVDSGLDFSTRVASYAAEGVELMVGTDHDQLTNYAPTIFNLSLEPWMTSQVGVEVSPLDYGHFIGFPVIFDENKELNGGFHWRIGTPGSTPDWRNVAPGQIYEQLRQIGSLGRERTVVFVAHFYDHFEFYDIDPWTLEPPAFGVSSIFNPVVSGDNFSGDFDALELLNGKNFDIIRRPTVSEVRGYNTELNTLVARGLGFEELIGEWALLSNRYQRDYMHRTQAEQSLAIDYNNPYLECRCVADSECGPGSICDEATGGCLPGCNDNSTCDAGLVAEGREACLPIGGDAGRKRCQRTPPSCTTDADCPYRWGGNASETCVAANPANPGTLTCEIRCTSNDVCERADDLRPVCSLPAGICVAAPVAGAADPCPTLRGVIDDWFQMLNRGVRRPILGNSDSHSTYDTEAGIPRTYVASSAEVPSAIRPEDVVASVKAGRALPTFGPFVELTVNGQPVGSTVTVSAGGQAEVRIRVQSPKWFDVDRIELYRNGELWQTVDGQVNCPESSTTCIKVPNDKVVNFNGAFMDTPAVDTWYVAVVMGLDGKTMAPVYSSTPVARLGTFELIQRLTPLLPPLRSLRIPFSPTISRVRPVAVTNPVWVDVGGDGLTPLRPLPSWATARDQAGAKPSARDRKGRSTGDPHAADHRLRTTRSANPARKRRQHDHRWGLGRLRAEAREFMRFVREGKLTPQRVREALMRWGGRRR